MSKLRRAFGIGKKAVKILKKAPLSIGASAIVNGMINKFTENEKDETEKLKKQGMFHFGAGVLSLFVPESDFVSTEYLVINNLSLGLASYTEASKDKETKKNAKLFQGENENFVSEEDFETIESTEEIEDEDEIGDEDEDIEEEDDEY